MKLLLGVSFLAVVVISSLHGYRFITTSPFFAIKSIDIRGNHHFNREQVLALAQIELGMNSLQVPITDLEKRLRENPWISDVSIKRRLPDAFEIRIKEWQPHFWITKNNILFYANIHGKIIAPVSADNFLSLPTLEIVEGGQKLLSLLPKVIANFNTAKFPVDIQAVSLIKLSAARGFELFLEKQNLTLCIAPEDWETNLKRLTLTIQDLANRAELKGINNIWASDNNVWVVKSSR